MPAGMASLLHVQYHMAHQPCRPRSDSAFVGLQSPLQPLQDNLESTTYETFERDGRKYEQYQLAIAAALMDRVPDAEAGATEVTRVRSPFQAPQAHTGAPALPLCASWGGLLPLDCRCC